MLQLFLVCIITACNQSDNKNNDILLEDKGFLQIPGVGWQTFFRTAQNDPTLTGLPFKSGCAYMRWTWGDLEPEEGTYAFDMIDEWLKKCREANQALAFRVMLSWPGHEGTIPQWLIDKGIKYTYSAFPNTPLTVLVDDRPNVMYANSKGRSGWRGDCWGNSDGPGVGWNHHEYSYWPMVNMMPDGWKTGTVALEPCGTFGDFPTPPETVVDDAISWHATFIQNKSHYIPVDWLPEIERLVMKLGFRLVLREIEYEKELKPGSDLLIIMKWQNLGIAPPYRDHRIALRLKNSNGENKVVKITDTSILGWLPGDKVVSISYEIPAEIEPGNYELQMGVVFHSSIEHVIPIANFGKTNDGWYMLGSVKIIR